MEVNMDYLFKALLSVAIVDSGIILICGGLLTLILRWKLVIWLARCKDCISEKVCDAKDMKNMSWNKSTRYHSWM